MAGSSRLALRRDRRGLTLVEMLVVLIVLGALLAIAVPSYLGMRERASDAVARNDLMQGRLAAHAYFVEAESYATLTEVVLRRYDPQIPARVTIGTVAADAYCLQTTVGGRTWALHGPAAVVEPSSCVADSAGAPTGGSEAPAAPGDAPGKSGDAPGQQKTPDDAPGKSGSAPGRSG